MTKLTRVWLALLIVVAVLSSGLFAQQGGKGRQGNTSGQRMQSNQGQQGRSQASRGQGRSRQDQSGQKGPTGQRGGNAKGQGSGEAINETERSELIQMREEEKLARDVYTAMQKKWGATIFANISRAESQHMQAIGGLLSRYKISDPVTNSTPGTFTHPKFQQLYRTLVDAGSDSLMDAFKVGLKIEEMDIADLRRAMQATDNNDLLRVYQHLEQGSQNHLRAFARQLRQLGGTYVATSLNQTDFDNIANSSAGQNGNSVRGGGGSQGYGNGPGNRNNTGGGMGKGKGRGK